MGLFELALLRRAPIVEMARDYFVYILSNRKRDLYVGVTNDLIRRIVEHRDGFGSKRSFTSRHQAFRLVFWEHVGNPRSAIAREKQLKSWKRKRKLTLIAVRNPDFRDLAEDLGLPRVE